MTIPHRGQTGHSTYFISASTYQKTSLFQTDRMAGLFPEVLYRYRKQGKCLLHEFVLMPNHFHLPGAPPLSLPVLERQGGKGSRRGGLQAAPRFGGELADWWQPQERDQHEIDCGDDSSWSVRAECVRSGGLGVRQDRSPEHGPREQKQLGFHVPHLLSFSFLVAIPPRFIGAIGRASTLVSLLVEAG